MLKSSMGLMVPSLQVTDPVPVSSMTKVAAGALFSVFVIVPVMLLTVDVRSCVTVVARL
jgi:hypothetical protein